MKKQILIAIGSMLFSAGIAEAQIAIRIGPPRPRREVIPARPYGHPDWAWRSGYQRWDGGSYVWVPGSYVAPPRPRARWYPGRWYQRRGGWYWREGYWR